jgi:transposase-like protein
MPGNGDQRCCCDWVAVGVDTDGHREILGLDVAACEDGAGRLTFLRSLTARGLGGVQLAVSDARTGLVAATGAVLSAFPGKGVETPTGPTTARSD